MQNQALRICSGAVKSSPVAAIQVEVGEMPLNLRRDQLALVYWANLKGHREDHIAHITLRNCQERLNKKVKSSGWGIEQKVECMGLSALNICMTVPYSTVPPWTFEELKVDLGLLEEKQVCGVDKGIVNRYITEDYRNDRIIFTDASKRSDKRVGVAHMVPVLGLAVGNRQVMIWQYIRQSL